MVTNYQLSDAGCTTLEECFETAMLPFFFRSEFEHFQILYNDLNKKQKADFLDYIDNHFDDVIVGEILELIN